jgi:hypothetical protein
MRAVSHSNTRGVVGNPAEGFTVVGPFDKSDDTGAVGEWARAKYGGSDFYQCDLYEPPEDGVRTGNVGTFVVISNSIEEPFTFFGPFRDYDAAVNYVERYAGGWAVMLHSIDREDIENAA